MLFFFDLDRHDSQQVLKYGHQLFSPFIPPGLSFIKPTINPKDIVDLNSSPDKVVSQSHQVITIGSTGHIEKIQTPFMNHGDTFFDVSSGKHLACSIHKVNLVEEEEEFSIVLPSSTVTDSVPDFLDIELHDSSLENKMVIKDTCRLTQTSLSFLNQHVKLFEDSRVSSFTQHQKRKRTRTNFDSDTIDVYMNWFLKHNGTLPTRQTKKELAQLTDKSVHQVSIWFQNAKKRYQDKVKRFKSLSKKHPDLVYDYQSFIQYVEQSNKCI